MVDYILAPDQDVVVSSRVRLARNFADIPFVHKCDGNQAEECIRRTAMAIYESADGSAYTLHRISELTEQSRQELVEHRLISSELVSVGEHGAALISSGRNVSVMINEDDHIRIQGMMPGIQLERAAELAFAAYESLRCGAEVDLTLQ